MSLKQPYWAKLEIPEIDYQQIQYYSVPKKKKQLPYTLSKQWCVSKYDDPQDIMIHATHSMTSLKQRLFAKTYKGQSQIKINKVLSKKEVGPFR